MKNLCLYILIVCLVSCSDTTVIPEGQDQINKKILTRVVEEGGEVSTSNPNLLTDWENQTYVLLSTGDKEYLPWIHNNTGSIPPEIARDIKKEDGWEMIFHTFTGVNENLHKNYMFFYNHLTGVLKVFYYSDIEVASNNNFMWEFGTANNSFTTLFPSSESLFFEPMNTSHKEKSVFLSPLTNDSTTGIKRGWNAFLLELPYTNDFISSNTTFRLTAINKEITEYNFGGIIEANTTGSVVHANNVNENNVSSTSHIFNNDQVMRSVKEHIAPAFLSDNSIETQNIIDIIKGVGKFFYKHILGKGEKSSIDKIELHTSGSIKLEGNGEQVGSAEISPMTDINLGKFNNYQGLGVWSLASVPIYYYERYSKVVPASGNSGSNINAFILSPEIYIGNAVVVFNPDIEQYIKEKHVTIDWAYMGKDGHISSKLTNEELEEIGYYHNSKGSLPGYTLYKSKGSSYTIPIYTTLNDNFSYYYDWGKEEWFDDDIVVNVTVELLYDCNGKETNYISSRSFKAIGKEDPAFSSIPSKPYTHILQDSDVDFY